MQTRMINRFPDDSEELQKFENATRIYYQREKVKAFNQEKLYAMIEFLSKTIVFVKNT